MRHATPLALQILVVTAGGPLASDAQMAMPGGWQAIADRADSSWRVESMPPGWHVTTGSGVLLFDSTSGAGGRFSVEARMFLFPGPGDAGYGVFLGARDLATERRSLFLFLVRRDGTAAVMRMAGADTLLLYPWQPHRGIRAQTGENAVENVLRVTAEPERTLFLVNGDTVAVVPRADGRVEGRFGLRIGAQLSVHVSSLDFTQHLALPPRR